MANWSNPTLTSTYTNFVTEVKDRDTDCATFLDGSTSTNLPTGAKRWNSTTNKFEKWSGTAWSDLATTYAIGISGNAANVTGVVAAVNGGTGQSVYAVGDLLYASTTTALSKLADVATGNALISGGVGVAPSWGKVALTTHVSGTLPVANGGTGVTTSTGSGANVLSTSPTFTTSAIAPLVIGGTGTTSPLALRSTSGVGAAGADIIFQVGNNGATEAMRVLNSGNVGIGTATPGAFKLNVAGAGVNIGATGTGNPSLQAVSSDAAGISYLALQNGTRNWSIRDEGTSGALSFRDDTAVAERMRIDTAGNVLLDKAAVSLANTGIEFKPGGYAGFTGNLATTNELVNFNNANTGNVAYDIAFRQQNTIVGSIRTNATTVSYNTSSDYRLKENIAPINGALAKVAALKPVTYTWKSDGSTGQGFIAHELAEVVPEAVTGNKDAIDADGKPVHQGIDPSKIIGLLTAAIQELKAELDALKAGLPAIPTASPPSP